MDIVTVNSGQASARANRAAQRRMSERRHTTEVRYDQLPSAHTLSELERDSITSLSTEDLTPRGGEEGYHPVADYGADRHLQNGKVYQPTFKTSWGSPSDSYHIGGRGQAGGSQEDLFQELNDHTPSYPVPPGGQEGVPGHHGYQLSYELALDNMLTPFAPPPPLVVSPLARNAKKATFDFSQSRTNHVMDEMVTTEITYVHDLSEVIEGYLMPLQMRANMLPFSNKQLASLFGNLSQIRDFHSSFLKRLNEGNTHVSLVGQCFLDKADGFKTIYTKYCNNYPNSIRELSELSKQPSILRVLKTCQQRLNHLLPLGAYLLKPVQRILKYSLLLTELVKSLPESTEGLLLVKEALVKMTEVAEHINAMKKKYDTAIHVQEIQSLIRGSEGLDLTKFGDLILEDNFRFFSGKGSGAAFRGRTERYVFLFQHLCLITKREEDGYQYKSHVEMKDLQLTERIEKEPNSFQIRQVSTGRFSTFQARTAQQREEWVKSIKVLLVESIPHLPDRARELIMKGFEVPRDVSPNRERRRHLTADEPSPVGGVSRGSGLLNGKSNSLGRNVTPQTMKQLGAMPPPPSSLNLPKAQGPSRRVSSPPVMHASLTGLMVSSVHSGRESPVQEERLRQGSRSSPDQQRDSGYSDSVAGDAQRLQLRGGEGVGSRSDGEELPVTPDSKSQKFYALNNGKSRSSTSFDHTSSSSDSAHHFHSVSDMPTLSSSFDGVLGLSHLTNSHVTASNSTHNGHAHPHPSSDVMTADEKEDLFHELINSSSDLSLSKKISSTDLDWGDRSMRANSTPSSTPTADDHAHHEGSPTSRQDSTGGHSRRDSSLDENSTTPKASPYTSPSTIRRWSVRKRRSYDYSDPEDMTPKASPFIPRHHSGSHLGARGGVVPPQEPHLSSDDSLSNPSSTILDPPTPFRTPPRGASEPRLQPPDEELELGHESASPCPSSDQDTPSELQDDPILFPDKQEGRTIKHDKIEMFKKRAVTLPPNMSLFGSGRGSNSPALSSSPKATNTKKKGSSSKSPVKRSKSFGNRNKIGTHKREGSLSTDNSPLPSPIFTTRKARHHTTSSPSPSPVAMLRYTPQQNSPSNQSSSPVLVGLISTTRTTPELQDIPLIQLDPSASAALAATKGGRGSNRGSLILPPPLGFEGVGMERSESRGSNISREQEIVESPHRESSEKSRFSFLRLKKKDKSSRSATPSDLTFEGKRRGSEGSMLDDNVSVPSPSVQTPPVFSPPSDTPPVLPRLHAATPTSIPDPIDLATPTNTTVPDPFAPLTSRDPVLEPCSDDMVSFEDALEDYNRYASETGKTARSARRQAAEAAHILSHSPLPSPKVDPKQLKKEKKSKKKKQRHGYTVASIDADTMREVKRLTEQEAEQRKKRNTSDSRVHQLAREYSRRIKEQNKPARRVPMVAEESLPPTPQAVKPVWLSDLNERRQRASLEDILDHMALHHDDVSSVNSSEMATPTEPLSRPLSNEDLTKLDSDREALRKAYGKPLFGGAEFHEKVGEEEGTKKKRFRGWVKSLVTKFGKKDHQGTTL